MDHEELNRAINYYKKKVEELAGENLKYDNIVSGLKHELRKNHKGFSLLSRLQRDFSELEEISAIFEMTIEGINETFSMDKSVILTPDSKEHFYKPIQWKGFSSDESETLPKVSINIPEIHSTGKKILLATRSTKPTPLITKIQEVFNLPFYVCIPIKIENMPTTLLLSGRLKEVLPFYPPLNLGDIDTFNAVAELITATIRNRHLSALKEVDRLKTEFFTNISHEFRTPLTLIMGPLEKLMEMNKCEEEQANYRMIFKNAQRLQRLINQLLDLSKLDAGKLNLQASKGNIVSFIKGVAMSFESLAEQKDIQLKIVPDKNDIELYFDRDKMSKILTNLLSNAFKFTGESGIIEISIKPTPRPSNGGDNAFLEVPSSGRDLGVGQTMMKEFVSISVRDTGIGISEEELPKLFDRFYQVDSSQTREHEGTGIGLALTKELVELHQGTILVESQKSNPQIKNSGWTEFIIKLPSGREHLRDDEIVDAPDQPEEKIIINEDEYLTPSSKLISESITSGNGERMIVLVVEDNPDMRAYIKNSLEPLYQVEEAMNGEQGLRKTLKIVPDLIVSDIMMPKMDGSEMTTILKNDERSSHIPIILLTAKAEQESKLEGLRTGADAYLTKPFDTRELHIRIEKLIEIRKKLQEKYSSGEVISHRNNGEKKLSDPEEKFISKVQEIIHLHLSEENFSIVQFSKEVGMSRVQLYRKLKALSGKSVSNYVKSVRLSKARKMIEERTGNISEIAYSVGFSSPQYFTRCFKEEFGHPPTALNNS
jgi:signal transduction histidine kinase/DNA-binding response OmpR family regulator